MQQLNYLIEQLDSRNQKLYSRLFDLIEVVETIPSIEWTVLHMLAYIIKGYKNKFNVDFILSYDNIPSKCIEFKLTSKLKAILQRSDPKEYIDWYYLNYNNKRKFHSINALNKIPLVIAFNDYKAKQSKITMYTVLPNDILSVAKNYPNLEYINTYGDLYFIYKADENMIEPILHLIDMDKLKGLDG